jgi:hypothetical protein
VSEHGIPIARQTPTSEEGKRVLVRWADLHRAVAAENGQDDGMIQAYRIDDVVVVTAHGSDGERLALAAQALLGVSVLAPPAENIEALRT